MLLASWMRFVLLLARTWPSGSEHMGGTADPDVPLPTGAAAGDWQPNDPLPYRVVMGEDHGVTDHKMVVHTVAIQFADGWIQDGRIKAATVYSGRGLSSTQARELAAALLEVADELDGWIEAKWLVGTSSPQSTSD